ncbi:DUF6090 family protein [Winogradskyella aurantia]|uniref:Uncharacterized protein n=1 Tax=Winogradskyella aurantia TaxID=1915063 RepID=A0A265USH1_9FLAO|nr:DUF6090 family protein [Winogradskyella aurantia]OZV68172.1 hypothetical protein CA834_11035 [Winogradskyella aurantia]
MIKFFRTIRYDLMEKNKIGRYLKYALGEIVLVVIGILIALQINNWNENRKEISKSLNYLKEFRKDLITDTISFNQALTGLSRDINSEVWALKKTKYNLTDSDSILAALGRTYYDRRINTRTFSSVQNSGNSKLIGYDSIFGIISGYYIKTNERLTSHTEWDKRAVTEGQDYKTLLYSEIEVDNNYIKKNSRTLYAQDFPMITDSSEQAMKIIKFATTVQARNNLKENYIRHLRLKNVFNQTKQEAKDLITSIDEELKN